MLIEKKIKSGKLLRLNLEIENDIIKNIKITGDFFMFPNESIVKLEKSLLGCNLSSKEYIKKINSALGNVTIIGFSKNDLIEILNNIKK